MKKAKSNFSKFMLLWTGELLSQIGGGLTSFGLGVYVFNATGSAAQMALVTLLGFLPTLLLSVPAGVLADMHDRRVLMMIGDGLSALGPLFILLCMMTGEAKLWQICIGVFVSAVFSALLEPSYRATITDLLTKEQFTRANGLTSLAGSARYLVSPMLAGVLLSVSDVKLLLIIDICTFFITVMATAVVKQGLSEEQDLVEEQSPAEKQGLSEEQRVAEKQEIVLTKSLAGVDEPNWKTPSGKRFAGKLKEGWNAIYSRKGVFFLIMISSVMTMFMGVIQILCEPMILSFADAGTLGTTETVSALGMLVTALITGIVGIKRNHSRVLGISLSFAGIFMVLFSLKENIYFICAAGFLFFAMLPLANSCLDYLARTNIPEELQGRAWGFIGFLSQLGYIPAYALAGVLADQSAKALGISVGRGCALVIAISGGLMILTALGSLFSKSIRGLEGV